MSAGTPLTITADRRFRFPLRAGFDYITDLRSWPDMISLAPQSRWSLPGDTVRRLGVRRAFDRIVVARVVERTALQTLDNLERRFAELSAA